MCTGGRRSMMPRRSSRRSNRQSSSRGHERFSQTTRKKPSTRFRVLFKNYDNSVPKLLLFDPLKTELRPSGPGPSLKSLALALLGSLAFLSFADAAPTITGTKGAVYPLNNDNSARPGDTITYTISVGNTAVTGVANDATGVQMADTIDPNSTFVNDSAKLSPNAIAHGYNAAGNTQLSVNAASGLLVGVVDLDGVTPAGSSVVTAGTFRPPARDTVIIHADGSFVYTP